MGAININHNEGSISTDNDTLLKVMEHGAIKLGEGDYLSELGNLQSGEIEESYEGAIRYNKNKGTLQYSDGVSWKDFADGKDETPGIIWAITF